MINMTDDDQNKILGILGNFFLNKSTGGNGLLNAYLPFTALGASPIGTILMQLLKHTKGDETSNQNKATMTPTPTSQPAASPSSDIDLAKLIASIGQTESGGDYGLLGKPTKNDRAYGKYQIMGQNIAPWGREALGRNVTVNEFMSNPTLQDDIAKYKLGEYYDKYGNINDVASMWFSGRPAFRNTRRDILGTSVPEYISRVNRNYSL